MADVNKPPLQGLNTPVGVWEMVPSPSCAADALLARHVRRPFTPSVNRESGASMHARTGWPSHR